MYRNIQIKPLAKANPKYLLLAFVVTTWFLGNNTLTGSQSCSDECLLSQQTLTAAGVSQPTIAQSEINDSLASAYDSGRKVGRIMGYIFIGLIVIWVVKKILG